MLQLEFFEVTKGAGETWQNSDCHAPPGGNLGAEDVLRWFCELYSLGFTDEFLREL